MYSSKKWLIYICRSKEDDGQTQIEVRMEMRLYGLLKPKWLNYSRQQHEIGTGQYDRRSNEQGYRLLYTDKLRQGNELENDIVKNFYLGGINHLGGGGHFTNLIYIGNKWVTMDIAGGERINYPAMYKGGMPHITFSKIADYDLGTFLPIETKRWLTMTYEERNLINNSNNFKSRFLIGNHFDNLGYKVYKITDQYGKHITKDTLSYINNWNENNVIESVNWDHKKDSEIKRDPNDINIESV